MSAAKQHQSYTHPGVPQHFARRQRIGPLLAVASNASQAAADVCMLAASKGAGGTHVHLINAYTVALADRDPLYAAVLSGDSINLPDGKPLSWVSRLRHDSEPLQQVRGQQLFHSVFDTGRRTGLRHFLLGSTDVVLAELRRKIEFAYPGVEIVGMHSPPFRALSESEVAAQDDLIRASRAQVVWVGLGTPKQDFEAKRLAANLPIVAVAVGAAFDFTAGTVKEAPPIVQHVGMEWAYRFMREPRRLWRRYVFGNANFIISILRHSRGSNRMTDQ